MMTPNLTAIRIILRSVMSLDLLQMLSFKTKTSNFVDLGGSKTVQQMKPITKTMI